MLDYSGLKNEIIYLQKNNLLQPKDYLQLDLIKNQEHTETHDQILENINSSLATSAIKESTKTKISAGFLGLSRLPKTLLNFIEMNKNTIETISLRNNNLSSITELMTFELPKLQAIYLEGNCLSESMCSEIRNRFNGILSSLDNQKDPELSLVSVNRVYLPSSGLSLREGVNPQTHKLENESTSRCTIM